jgi:AraC-like DNA-binding protein
MRLAGGRSWLVWHRPGLWATVLWGAPNPSEAADLVRTWSQAFDEERQYVSLVDCGNLSHVDPAAFQVLFEFMGARRADFERLLTRQAVVRPDGMVGTVVMGFLAALEYQLPVQAFATAKEALAWLSEDGESDARELEKLAAEARETAPVVREVRDLLDGDLTLELSGLARLLGRSTRALQHQLGAAGVSFRQLRTTARMERAQKLLSERDDKITSIALEVGCASLQHFARMFRAHTGMSPLEWRRRRE